VDLTDAQWIEVWDVAEAKAMKLTHGNAPLAEDLASLVVEKLFVMEGVIDPAKLKAYVRTMVQNAYFDRLDKQKAAYRPKTIKVGDFEADVLDEVAGVFKYQLNTTSPSRRLVRREMQQARAQAYLDILASLPEKQQALVRMAAEGRSHKDIAQQLGYANSSVVKTTLHRVYAKIRDQFNLRHSDYFGTSAY